MKYPFVALVKITPDAPQCAAVRVPPDVEPGDAAAFQFAPCSNHSSWWGDVTAAIGVVKSVISDEAAIHTAAMMTPGGEIPPATAIWKRVDKADG